MATSSLSKYFVIKERKTAKELVELISSSNNKPLSSENSSTICRSMSDERMRDIISAKLGKSK